MGLATTNVSNYKGTALRRPQLPRTNDTQSNLHFRSLIAQIMSDPI
jgi:hypothetical protein